MARAPPSAKAAPAAGEVAVGAATQGPATEPRALKRTRASAADQKVTRPALAQQEIDRAPAFAPAVVAEPGGAKAQDRPQPLEAAGLAPKTTGLEIAQDEEVSPEAFGGAPKKSDGEDSVRVPTNQIILRLRMLRCRLRLSSPVR